MVNRFSHIGVVVEDLDKAKAEWCERYGLNLVGEEMVEVEGVRNAYVSTAETKDGATCIELIEPLDKGDMSNAIARRLAQSGEGVYHAAFVVEDPAGAGEQLRGHGVTVIDRDPVDEDSAPRAVIHPKSANGLLLELL